MQKSGRVAQDDVREREMRTLFNLELPPDRGRADVDAILVLDGVAVPEELRGRTLSFELKSSTSGRPNISTVRDFGLHHIEKWRPLHWLFGVYEKDALVYCLYGAPKQMAPWFDDRAQYIEPDVRLAEHVPGLVTDETLSEIIGAGGSFSLSDARRVMKNQLSTEEYLAAADLEEARYSRAVMLQMLRNRCRYVIERGSTLNNPHIPAAYFAEWERIERNHASRLRELVIEALGS